MPELPTVACPTCQSLIANDDVKLRGRTVTCPKCKGAVKLPRLGSENIERISRDMSQLNEKQLLVAIYNELVTANKTLFVVWCFLLLLAINLFFGTVWIGFSK